MYYLRTKAAVDAIKFTLDNSKKEEEPVVVAQALEATTANAKAIEVNPVAEEIDIQPMTAEEMKALIARSKEGQADDDCLMCGS